MPVLNVFKTVAAAKNAWIDWAVIATGLSCAVVLLTTVFGISLGWRTVTLDKSLFRHEVGNSYTVSVPYVGPNQVHSRLFESGQELNGGDSLHADIRESGNGRFSHWGRTLWFSSTDNSDPRSNDRIYKLTYQCTVLTLLGKPGVTVLIGMCLVSAALFLARTVTRLYPAYAGYAFCAVLIVFLKPNVLDVRHWFAAVTYLIIATAIPIVLLVLCFMQYRLRGRCARTLALLAVFAPILITGVLLGLECISRAFPVYTTLAINPGLKYFWPDYVERQRNSAGVLEVEIPPKAPDEYRIMVVGDSYVAGAGVAGSRRVAAKLQQNLAGTRPGTDVKCFTFGICGYNTVQQAKMIARHLDQVSPDLVVLGYVFNDAEDPANAGKPQTARPIQVLNSWLLKSDGSYLWYRVFTAANQLAGEQQDYYAEIYSDQFAGWQKSVAAFKEIKAMLSDKSIPFVVSIFPIFSQSLSDVPGSSYEKSYLKVLGLMDELNIACIDTKACFAEKHINVDELAISRYDCHPNAKAHEQMAEIIAEYLIAENIIPESIGEISGTK